MKTNDCPVLSILEQLLAVPSPPGREDRMAEVVRGLLRGWGYEPETDPAGNVLVRLPGRNPDGPTVCVAAHLDEIAMVVTLIEDNGDLHVLPSGGIIPFKVGERAMVIMGDYADVTGVLSFGSTHRSDAHSMGTDWADVRVITGMTRAELDEAGVRPGTSLIPGREGRGPFVLGTGEDPLIAAWTFDDRAGMAALLHSLHTLALEKRRPAVHVIAAFTVHEEGGCHGAKVLAHRERPDVFLAIDGCPIVPDSPLLLDGRPGIWSKDMETNYDQRLFRQLREIAKAAGTDLQPVVFEHAASDAGKVYTHGAAPRVAIFGQVRRNSHGFEVARKSVFGNIARVLTAFLTTWEG